MQSHCLTVKNWMKEQKRWIKTCRLYRKKRNLFIIFIQWRNNRIDFQLIRMHTLILEKTVCIFLSLYVPCHTWHSLSFLSIYFLSISFLILKNIDVNLFSLCNISSQRMIIMWNHTKEKVFYWSFRSETILQLHLDKQHFVFYFFFFDFFFQWLNTYYLFFSGCFSWLIILSFSRFSPS